MMGGNKPFLLLLRAFPSSLLIPRIIASSLVPHFQLRLVRVYFIQSPNWLSLPVG